MMEKINGEKYIRNLSFKTYGKELNDPDIYLPYGILSFFKTRERKLIEDQLDYIGLSLKHGDTDRAQSEGLKLVKILNDGGN